ncbi:TetR/AcrR family transcriptional regulator [Streptomyces sp. GS7]|uniref:TetR/AcrR family transcriptional regulator n=1 Tax=Streptomyces sp. GS7 TaxID=2692234 RepID=UPI003FA69692
MGQLMSRTHERGNTEPVPAPRDDRPQAAPVDPEQLWLAPDRPRRGRRPAFSREAITAAAVALADTEGLDAVTMRRVAAQVGAGAMSLYSYAPDKETLLELMVDHVTGELPLTDPLTGDWRTDLKHIARLQRAHMHRHPWLPAALGTRRTLGPHTLAFLERALAALGPTGLDGAAKLEVFSLLTGFVASHVSHELTRSAAHSPDRAAAEARYLTVVAADGRHPELAAALAAPGRPPTPDATFARFLDRLVDGLDTEPGAGGGEVLSSR